MALQFSVALRTAMVAQIQAQLAAAGGTHTLKIFTGGVPTNCAAPDPAGPLVSMNLPAVCLSAANGVTALVGSWTGIATASGTANSFRMYDGAGACVDQGNTTTDLVLNNQAVVNGQQVSVTEFAALAANA